MTTIKKYSRHYEDDTLINTDAERIFVYADDPTNFSSHMNKSSWMMGGGSMKTDTDEGKGQKIGSHIKMGGKVIGINLFLDEIVTRHEPPFHKEWETVGDLKLLVIDHYRLGFEIKQEGSNCARLKVYIDYNLPQSPGNRILGYLFGEMYAKWCVYQMINGVKEHFKMTEKG